MKETLNNKQSKRVLVFNPLKRYIAKICSVNAAAEIFHTSPANITLACNGNSISCCGFYFRHLDPRIELGEEDEGVLRLEEYDKLCGVERKYYPTKAMCRKGMKYNSKNKRTNGITEH